MAGELVLILVPLLAGYALDLVLGDPRWLPHPVVGFGRLIAAGERRLNRGGARGRFLAGAALTLALVAGVWALAALALAAAGRVSPWLAAALATVAVFYGLANRTLVEEGRAVAVALGASLDAGRRQVARIVGRDTVALSPHQVRAAACETMAENLSDGVVAPLFYFAVGGAPAMLAYKMVNTLDSMIGHRDERHEWFGKFAARLDDLANLVPARLTAAMLALVAASPRAARFVVRYGRAHASPNSGYPEAALAGVLDARFGGPLRYDGELVEKPWIGENPRELTDADIVRAARLNHAVCALAVALVAVWITRGFWA